MLKVATHLRFKVLAAALACCPFFAFAKIRDPDHVLGPYSRAERKLEKIFETLPGKNLLEKIEAYERDHSVDAESAYSLKRMRLRQYDDLGRTQDAMNICTQIKPDDFEMSGLCIYLNPNRIHEKAIQETEKIWEQSQRELPGTIVPVRIAIIILNLTFEATDMSRAREVYQKALAAVPRDAKKKPVGSEPDRSQCLFVLAQQ